MKQIVELSSPPDKAVPIFTSDLNRILTESVSNDKYFRGKRKMGKWGGYVNSPLFERGLLTQF